MIMVGRLLCIRLDFFVQSTSGDIAVMKVIPVTIKLVLCLIVFRFAPRLGYSINKYRVATKN